MSCARRECINTNACSKNLLCSGISHACLLPPLLLFNLKYDGASPVDITESVEARVCSNIFSLVPGLKGKALIGILTVYRSIVSGHRKYSHYIVPRQVHAKSRKFCQDQLLFLDIYLEKIHHQETLMNMYWKI